MRFTGHHRGVTSVAEPHGAWFSPLEVFDIVAKELGGGVEDVKLDKKGLHMRFVGDYCTEPPKKAGDVSHAGLVVKMNGNVKIGPYSYRMVCSNGMMRMYEKLELVDTRDMITMAVRSACQAQYAASRELTDQFIGLDTSPFTGNREQTLIQLGHQSGLPARFVTKALERLPELPEDATMYDMVNIITQMASELRQPEKVQVRAGRLVNFLADKPAFCDHCGKVVCTG